MRKKRVSIFNKIATGILVAVLTIASFLNVFTLLSVYAIKDGGHIETGYFCAIVSSGSMEPAVSVNDLLIIAASNAYQAGDIVTYVSPRGSLVTHRVVEAFDESYLTRGDANNVLDDEVAAQRILGKVIAVVPGVGGIIDGILSPLGIALLICLFIVIWWLREGAK